MKKKLFTLSPMDRFRLGENNYMVVKYKQKTLLRLGRVTVLQAIDSNNKKCLFTRNFEVNSPQ